jgi:hypothetical protein
LVLHVQSGEFGCLWTYVTRELCDCLCVFHATFILWFMFKTMILFFLIILVRSQSQKLCQPYYTDIISYKTQL